MNFRPAFRPVPLLFVLVAALLLAGCSTSVSASGPPVAATAGPASAAPSSTSSPSSAATPTVDPTDAVNATTVLPADFPPVIPLIDGDIVTASETASGWVVWVKSDDPISGYQDASGALQDAGFAVTADQSINGSADGVFTDDSYTVTVSAGSDAKYPDAVGYEVEKK